jgi:hypothetical protein
MPQVFDFMSIVMPRVDISGDTTRYGHITKKGCVQIGRVAGQGAWALVRSKRGGSLHKKILRSSSS